MRIIIAGSRDHRITQAQVFPVLDASPLLEGATLILSGACPTGVDHYGEEWARLKGLDLNLYPADWSKGRGAGPARNALMVGLADGLVAILDRVNPCKGTRDVIKRAQKAGLAVEVFTI
jgi:hypothetical protein